MSSPRCESDKAGSISAVRTSCHGYSLKPFELDSTALSVPVAMPQFCAGAGTQTAEMLRDASSSHRHQGTAVPVKELSWEVNPLLVSCSRDPAEQEWEVTCSLTQPKGIHVLIPLSVTKISSCPTFCSLLGQFSSTASPVLQRQPWKV